MVLVFYKFTRVPIRNTTLGSLTLTLINILCIIFTGVFILWIKADLADIFIPNLSDPVVNFVVLSCRCGAAAIILNVVVDKNTLYIRLLFIT
jgi:hypothetical protein